MSKRLLLLTGLFLLGCGQTAVTPTLVPTVAVQAVSVLPTETASPLPTATLPPPPTPPIVTPVPTATVTETAVPTAILEPTASPTLAPTITPSILCSERTPEDGLLALVTKTYGLSGDFAPDDLVSVNDHLPHDVTLGIPMEVREVALEPLLEMVDAMVLAGLRPYVVSGYRDHYSQALAYSKWAAQFPDRVDAISARPGHSEHQLGTTVDFSSPELPTITGDPTLQFHTDFIDTSEGLWLAEHAHEYGFTLSFPADGFEFTGFNYEPWHYRYVGIDLATRLHQLGISFSEYKLLNEPAPCIPDDL